MLDYIATGKVDPDRVATVVAGVHEGCRQAGCALIGGETAEHAGVMPRDELDLAGFAVGVVEEGTQLGPERVRGRRRRRRAALARPAVQRLHPGPPRAARAGRARRWTTRPGRAPSHSVADELLRPSVIYTPAVLALRAGAGRRLPRLRPHHRRRDRRQPAPGPARRPRRGARAVGLGRAAGLRRDPAARLGGRGRDGPGLQPRRRHGAGGRRRLGRRGAAGAGGRRGSPPSVIGEVVGGRAGSASDERTATAFAGCATTCWRTRSRRATSPSSRAARAAGSSTPSRRSAGPRPCCSWPTPCSR